MSLRQLLPIKERAGSRLLVEESIKTKLLDKILEHTRKLSPADPLDPTTRFGAIVNEAHMKKVLDYIQSGTEQGADLIQGGKRIYPHLLDNKNDVGYYIEPTIFENVKAEQKIYQEEIFGPVLSVTSFSNDDEAIDLANNSRYGLSAYAATTDLRRAQRLGQALNTGRLIILGTSSPSGNVDLAADKHRESGFGYSGGLESLEGHTVSTTVHLLT